MRSPENVGYRPGRIFEEDLNLRYLSPGAFTVLAPEDHGSPTSPPAAPVPYRISPNPRRRNKNQSFAIIADPLLSPRSRSPSPTGGRVSPFRGRGFNPNGSRHASPASSPPPPPSRTQHYTKKSQIPQLRRRGSEIIITDESGNSPKYRRKTGSVLKPQLSKSLSNIGPKSVTYKPPVNPYNRGLNSRLSPIIGSSPEPSSSDNKSISSPGARITHSRSTPPSRKTSPTRSEYSLSSPVREPFSNNRNAGGVSKAIAQRNTNRESSADRLVAVGGKRYIGNNANNRLASRNTSKNASANNSREVSPDVRDKQNTIRTPRNQSRNPSRTASREQSPTAKSPFSPTRIPIRNYKNVPAKVNSNTTKKPKAASPTPNIKNKLSSNSSKTVTSKNKGKESKIENTNRPRLSSVSGKKVNGGSVGNNNNNNNNNNNGGGNNNKEPLKNSTKPNNNNNIKNSDTNNKKNEGKATTSDSKVNVSPKHENKTDKKQEPSQKPLGKTESVPKLSEMLPSTTTVVSTTTSTVTQPLKIDAKLENNEPVKPTPMYMDEGRVLSAKSVSNAIERMNDTVLDSQTLLKDHNLHKLSGTVVSLSQNADGGGGGIGAGGGVGGNASVLPDVENVSQNVNSNNSSSVSNNVNNTSKLVSSSPEKNFGAKVNNHNAGSNDRSKENRTVVTSEVKPIRITVKEKANDPEVQSGNVRFTNGVVSSPSIPPSQNGENGNNQQPAEGQQPPRTRCQIIMEKCRNKMPCCKAKPPELQQMKKHDVDNDDDEVKSKKTGCFWCCGRKGKKQVEEIIISSAEDVENGMKKKKSCLERLKCCKSNKVGDSSTTGCCGRGARKDSWSMRRDSILSDVKPLTKGEKCKNFFKRLFCCGCACCTCCKKSPPPPPKIDEASRRASMMSKKKSLTPTVLPPEEPKHKLDSSLVEYTSNMKAAIPVLPVALAYFCLVFNCIAPGTGTVFSGLFCLCLGIPRFSPRDGPKPRIGSFIINTVIGCGQLFTVLFCLVGWGWSIWWGVIMIKIAKKHRKLKKIEERLEAQQEKQAAAEKALNDKKRDVEKGGAQS